MAKVTVFLRTSLFCIPGADSHVPRGTAILEGKLLERLSGSISFAASRMLDDKGRELAAAEVLLEIPWSKIDHILLPGD